jgi:2-polyprenyl-3-methyl-5-hydroxy-6-metoxy-1,4-benzoquinol methylase
VENHGTEKTDFCKGEGVSEQKGKAIQGKRFEFGKNWQRFLSVLNEDRFLEAEKSLKQMLEIDNLNGKSFLDIGSGSGLFSLAARRLGAKVYSFDYDPISVACTMELKRRYFLEDANWTIERGDVLNTDYLNSLGQFDLVYSWGVLHHTGNMWQALENVISLVAPGGKLFLSIYNDQGGSSRRWAALKKFYNQSSRFIQFLITLIFSGYFGLPKLIRRHKSERGMSFWHDLIDWLGGFPFEVAKPEQIFDFYKGRGFLLLKLRTFVGGLRCNEFLFYRLSNNEKIPYNFANTLL